ncbi:hypothetical protein C2E23DRAFT_362487 [Lenzites betulinus]|nr:hypothetical protein C2E23DRAFT_362487 [Lenzites betulinus]
MSQHYSPGHVAMVAVFPHGETTSRLDACYYLVSRPVVSSLSLVGRGTRGYWAVDLETSSVVFLKDTWRIDTRRGSVEGDVLERLNDLGVRHVPSLVIHGDVPDFFDVDEKTVIWQHSWTDDYVDSPWLCRVAGRLVSAKALRRYRIVVSTVGYGLQNVKGTEELLHATYDVFVAMRDALLKDSRIHRDLSLGNIILVKEPGQEIRKGYLIDWEVSDEVDEFGESYHSGRAGTWLYMSWRMQDGREVNGRHTFQDDMDSLIHVITHCALLYLPHHHSSAALAAVIQETYERDVEIHGVKYGGEGKRQNTYSRHLIKRAGFESQALVEWLNGALDLELPEESFDMVNFSERFTPENMDEYWSTFLRTHKLEKDNRTVHFVSQEEYYDLATISTTILSCGKRARSRYASELSTSSDGPKPSRSPRAFHLSDSSDLSASSGSSNQPAPKRHRTTLQQASLLPLSRPPALGPATGPRRSERIKSIQSCVLAPPVAAQAATSNPSPRVSAHHTGRGRGRGRGRDRGRGRGPSRLRK